MLGSSSIALATSEQIIALWIKFIKYNSIQFDPGVDPYESSKFADTLYMEVLVGA